MSGEELKPAAWLYDAWVAYEPVHEYSENMKGHEVIAAIKHAFVSGYSARAHPLPEQPQEGERYRRALEKIKQATIDGEVCDDVAWFDKFTTLYDFIDMVLDPPEPPVFRDLFPSTETKESGE